jgi:site-specific recombinase XerD
MQSGYNIRTMLEFPGHSYASTTMIYTYVMNKDDKGVVNPLDRCAKTSVGALPVSQ